MPKETVKFAVFGGGAWGTALAASLIRAGNHVTLWAREPHVVNDINDKQQNSSFLPNVILPAGLQATTDLEAAGRASDIWLMAIPAQHSRSIYRQLLACARPDQHQPIILCAKGIEQGTLLLPAAVATQELPTHPLLVLSGPTFASEVASGKPAAITLACSDLTLARSVAEAINCPTLRPYISDDVTGAQIGGAIKNVLAIACGVSLGCNMGENARAALITRGLAEMVRLAIALGGKPQTMMGLSGLGDLVLTCCGMQSRNMSVGMALGRGERLSDIITACNSVAEGVYTASAARELAQRHQIDMPITTMVDAILNADMTPEQAMEALVARPLKMEQE